MAERHKWADVIIAWANGEAIQISKDEAPFRDYTGGGPNFHDPSLSYRIKPSTIKIGDMEVPEPLRAAPAAGTRVYWPHLNRNDFTDERQWFGDSHDLSRLKRGIVHLTEQAAIAHAKALIAVSGGTI